MPSGNKTRIDDGENVELDYISNAIPGTVSVEETAADEVALENAMNHEKDTVVSSSPDKKPVSTLKKSDSTVYPIDGVYEKSEEELASIFGLMFFTFLNKTLSVGAKKQLDMSDLPRLHSKLRSEVVCKQFNDKWQEEAQKPNPSIVKCYWHVIRRFFWTSMPFMLIWAGGPFSNPILLEGVLISLSNPLTPWWEALLYVLAMVGANLVVQLSMMQVIRKMFTMGIAVNAANSMALYRKGLFLSNSARQDRSQGQIMNHLSTDAQTIFNFTGMAMFIVVVPIQVFLAIFLLQQRMGAATWVAIAVLVGGGPINAILGMRFRKITQSKLANTDIRMKLINDVIAGIRLIKLYAWENSFVKRVMEIRNKETVDIKRYYYNMAFLMVSMGFLPVLVILGTLGAYVTMGNVLTAIVVFPTINLLQLLQMPLGMFPMMIGFGINTAVSVKRIKSFLMSSERIEAPHDPVHFEKTANDVYAGAVDPNLVLFIKDGVFRWKDPEQLKKEWEEEQKRKKEEEDKEKEIQALFTDGDRKPTVVQIVEPKEKEKDDDSASSDSKTMDSFSQPTLPRINVELHSKELLMIIGPVGCGKSSVLAAMLGDINLVSGSVGVKGNVAYVGQKPWIATASLRDNIIGQKPFDQEKIDKVIKACVLRDDIELLDGGLDTEIGEKGVTLSGGQLARVSLAQAVYADADVYLLDDILSAVDAHVGRKIFESLLHREKGMLKDKAVVLVTNQLQFLSESSHIVTMSEEGTVTERGTFTELRNAGLDFNDLIDRHAKQQGSGHGRRRSSRSGSAMPEAEAEDAKEDTTVKKNTLIQEEERVAGAVATRIYKRLIKNFGGKGLFAAMLCFGIFAVLFQSAVQGWVSVWTDGSWFPGLTNDMYLLGYGGLVIISLCFQAMLDISFARGVVRAVTRLHDDLFSSVIRAPTRFFDTTPMGRIINRFAKDVFSMDLEAPMFLKQVYFLSLILISMIALVLAVAYPVVIALIPAVYLFIRLLAYYRHSAREMQRLDAVSKSFVMNQFSESLNGISTLWAYKQVDSSMKEMERKIDVNHRAFYVAKMVVRWLNSRSVIIISFVMLATGVVLILMRGILPISFAGLALTMFSGVLHMLNQYVQQLTELETRMTSVERIVDYSEMESEAPAIVKQHRPEKSWPAHGKIEFRKVSMRYREGLSMVFNDLTFTVNSGEKLGVVGRTGAGKSSLAVALFRLVEPCSGQIFIDDVDISEIGLEDLRLKMAIIPQQPVLFEGTVRFNLDPFDEFSDAEIWKVLEIVQLRAFIGEMPQKLSSPVKEGGANFSVGQRQLICIARALLRKSRIIVLDEATASVDVETDALIQKMVREAFKECTVITIAHRLNTIIDSDRILVMKAGKAAEVDTPQVLVHNPKSLFAELVDETGPENAAHLREVADRSGKD